MIVLYDNLVDKVSTTLSASSSVGLLVAENMRKDLKSFVWRSSGTSATLNVNFGSSQWIRGVVLAFTNLSAVATIQVNGIVDGIAPDPLNPDANKYNTTGYAVPAEAVKPWDWGPAPTGANTYSYGGGNYARFIFPSVLTSSVTITINDPGNTDGYIEVSRLLVGNVWEPKYTADYGASVGVQDSTQNNRSDAGDLISDRGYRHRTMSIDFSTLSTVDRNALYEIMRSSGIGRPMLVSLFPYDLNNQMERDHMIYGKLSSLDQISMQFINMFAGNITIEEI